MVLKRVVFVCGGAWLLYGCVGPTAWVEPIDLKTVPVEERAAAAAVKIFETGQTAPDGLTPLGDVQATSCKNKTWDPPATKGAALQQIRRTRPVMARPSRYDGSRLRLCGR